MCLGIGQPSTRRNHKNRVGFSRRNRQDARQSASAGTPNRDRIATDCDQSTRQARPIATESTRAARQIATNRHRPAHRIATDCDRIATNRRDRLRPIDATDCDRLRPNRDRIATDCDRIATESRPNRDSIGRPPPTLSWLASGIRSSFSQFFWPLVRFFTKSLFFCPPVGFFTKSLFFLPSTAL